MIHALDVPGLALRGLSDLAPANARSPATRNGATRGTLVHHGTQLYDLDSRLVAKYLKEPARQPDYRNGRRHTEFLGNLPLSADEISERLAGAFDPRGIVSPI
jgi:lipoate-protein ligase A